MTATPARVLNADCLTALRDMPDASVDAIVTDPPYGLSNTTPAQVADTITQWVTGNREYLPTGRGFMGHEWDGFVPPVAVWDECLRVLKPGGHLLAFAGSRTHDLMTLGIRLAGFEIRDSVAWLYGSGFPKSMDVSKAIDKAAGAVRETKTVRSAASAYSANVGNYRPWMDNDGTVTVAGDTPATDAARQWEGWGTALKPAFEPVTLARKPLTGTVAANVQEHGTGALNIDACRIYATDDDRALMEARSHPNGTKAGSNGGGIAMQFDKPRGFKSHPSGRWPANVVLDESQAAELDRQSGTRKSSGVYDGDGSRNEGHRSTSFAGGHRPNAMYADTGGASRFMYVAKAPKSERPVVDGTAHPTVKPLALMRWLVRMVTPPGGTVLDPFAGSGTTLEAAMLEGFNVTGIEREADYLPLIHARIERATTTLAVQAEADADTLFPIDGAAS